MIKIITFLGDRGGLDTIYQHQGKNYRGQVFAEALHQFCTYDAMLVCVTDKAKENSYPILAAYNDPRIQPVHIPTGYTTEEMWQTFQLITAQINEGDRVIFDITHGLRSLPFLVFLFAAYLKAAKNIEIQAIYYGALELREAKDNPAPVIDLSEFVGMLDWIAATDRFVKVGDGLPLAELLKNAIPGIERANDPAVRPLARQLDHASKIIGEISQAIALVRPLETLKLTVRLEKILNKADASFDQRAKPFTLIARQLLDEYGQFALSDSLDSENLSRNLWLQFQMIDWYMKRGQVMQAMTLAGEWLISVVAYRLGSNHLLDNRQQVGFALNNGSAILQKKQPQKSSEFDQAFQALPDYRELSDLRGKLSEIRNDLAHVGMNKNPKSAKNLMDLANKIFPRLQSLAETFLISDNSSSVDEPS
ncbi:MULTISPECIES: TIGR02221 family CRISPR-associated protein [unclassified Synechocystis]|uniref:TIGR02221 family CRISPR-associated protein n=1 Tax=unclassified Synechocystis TaxID=2640012 RepID=UPI00040D86D2|nr:MULTISPECIES: TIGR02221 family CRISPR-associated protein [unclassified Synechocystis]AIE73560.1 CRISPR-associated protein TM1812 [Synechocystis sp. PCC 6714]MCT0254106.1 TIGR02221 family CRISPR-associated protein [Synechocystis sp. CS-94]